MIGLLQKMNHSNWNPIFRAVFIGAVILSTASSAFSKGTVQQLAPNGGWCWFSGPSAIYDNGNVLTGWITNTGDVQVGSYRADTGQTSAVTIRADFEPDDHDHPAFYKTSDGRITAFYSPHGGKGKCTQYCTTVNPGSIAAWTDSQSLNTNTIGNSGATYVNPYQVPGSDPNQIMLFWRGGNYSPTYSTGTYDPATTSWTWSTARNFIYSNTSSYQRPYVRYGSTSDSSRIGALFTNGHPGEITNNVYFAYLSEDTNGNLAYYQPNGTKIQNLSSGPITPNQASVVFDKNASGGATDNAWVWDTAFDKNNNPVVVYSVFPDNDKNIHQYWWARWNGDCWDNRLLVENSGGSIAVNGADGTQPYYSGGITLDHDNPGTVYLASKNEAGGWDLEQWKTNDNGASWSDFSITTGSTQKNIRPIVPVGHPSDTDMVLWMSGTYDDYYEDYNTAIKIWTCPVPEPSTFIMLLGVAGIGFIAYVRRRQR